MGSPWPLHPSPQVASHRKVADSTGFNLSTEPRDCGSADTSWAAALTLSQERSTTARAGSQRGGLGSLDSFSLDCCNAQPAHRLERGAQRSSALRLRVATIEIGRAHV